jgi:hypothetical protein
MPVNENKRLTPPVLAADFAVYEAIQVMEGYTPVRPEYTLDEAQRLADQMAASQAAEQQLRGQLDAARDKATADEWAFHNAMLGVKEQVRALFGSDSDEVQALGLKKKGERKPPRRQAEEE